MNTARALSANLASLLRREHSALGAFLVALADFDRRRAWMTLGHASLFAYLHRELRLSKAAAQYRKVAAELIEEVPAVGEALGEGRLCLTSIVEAARVVTAQNWETVLPRFFGLSRREAMEVVAELQPHPAPPTRTIVSPMRTAPSKVAAGPASALPTLPLEVGAAGPAEENCTPGSSGELTMREGRRPAAPAAAPRPAEVVPLTADLRRFHLTVSDRFLRKLQAAKDALSHARPGATEEELLEAGLDLLLEKAAKRKGLVAKPRKTPRPAKSDHIPAHVKRAVMERDGGRCQFRLPSGEICGSTHQLEFDHIEPVALGGASTVDNVRIACRRHNIISARRVFGDDWMDRYAPGKASLPAETG
ncbi:HNH endonuclease [Anaeromyxobacter oryzae]|uniref:HNH nuclease domain-containing protein n=1 Tax=Anaeromyxobacter oryzae TaxID=2918170 RepID=A0ABN6MR69_9BACT|nr:HNH endonuclease signature motif containing protein [Anaeromyxobacter oryzae]BDG02189.1 hypothetical protein AMOR_11850 [Anaeromyxobacter oryzae]